MLNLSFDEFPNYMFDLPNFFNRYAKTALNKPAPTNITS